jgi:hypothetical protein
MEDPLAPGHGGHQHIRLELVGLEQAQVLRCPFQLAQVSILGSPEMASAGIDQEQRRSGGVLGNGYGGVLRLGLVWLISFRSGLIWIMI